MFSPSPKTPSPLSPLAVSVIVAVVGAAAIAGAWFFQLVIGLRPCPLCLEQRIPYYIAIPLALIVAFIAWRGSAPRLARAGLAVLALVLLVGAGLGAYHAGIEWKWWPGPTDCTGDISNFGKAGSLLEQMQNTSIVRCDEAAWRFLGLSLAGYNVFISLALAALCAIGLYGSSSVSQYK
jgi:disulfide bond formation protein DsbB